MWCGDCAGQCAPLCDCMPPRLRLSLDTSQPSRPADLYPTVTLSERQRETEREGERREGKSKGIERKRDRGRHEERMQKAKCCHKARDQIERRGEAAGTSTSEQADRKRGMEKGKERKRGSDEAMDNSK